MEPAALINDFAGSFRILVVALHNARALDDNLTVIRDAHLNVGNRPARTANTVRGIVVGDNWRGLRQSVTLVDRYADGPKELGKLFRQGRAAGTYQPQAAAGTLAYFLVHQQVSELPLELDGEAG